MKKYYFLISLFAFICNFAQASTQAKFGLIASTPNSIKVPANRHAIVQYKVTNNTTLTRTLTMKKIPHVTQLFVDNSQCPNPFVLGPSESCNLTLYVDGATLTSTIKGGPVVCKKQNNSNKPDPFMCSQPEENMLLSIKPIAAVTPTTNKLYVSNWTGNSVSLCYLQAGLMEHCLVSAVSDTFLNPEALAINGNFLFVANIGGGMSSCAINAGTGELNNCINAVPDSMAPIYAPDGISILAGKAYIANSGPELFHQGVTVCDVAGSLLINCAFTQGNATFSVPSDLAIYSNTVYVTNYNSQDVQTVYCTIGSPLCTTGTGEGTITGTMSLLDSPEGLSFATINAVNYAYFTNNANNTITLCQVQSPTNFVNCANTGGYFAGFGNLAILTSPLKAYVPSGLKSVSTCDVNSSDGSLSNCTQDNKKPFNSPSGLIIN